MNKTVIKPSRKYVWKLRLILGLIAFSILLAGFLIAAMIAIDGDNKAASTLVTVMILLNMLWLIPGMLMTGPYYRSLRYEICDDEVIVNVGIVTKTVKHVPYRTVTNITINRGLLDRLIFDIGTLKIQTAGMSGQTGAEEELVGMQDVQEVYQLVVHELRKFRGGMTPTAADADIMQVDRSAFVMDDILEEVRLIRQQLEKST